MDFPLLSSTYSSAQQALISANNPCIRRPVPLPDKFGNCVKMTSSAILQYLSKQAYFHHFLWTCLFFADFYFYFTLLFCQDGHKMRGYEEKKRFSFLWKKLCGLKEYKSLGLHVLHTYTDDFSTPRIAILSSSVPFVCWHHTECRLKV